MWRTATGSPLPLQYFQRIRAVSLEKMLPLAFSEVFMEASPLPIISARVTKEVFVCACTCFFGPGYPLHEHIFGFLRASIAVKLLLHHML